MQGYFSRFPDTDRKPMALWLTTTLQFALGTLFDPDADTENDPRLEVLYALTEMLDGVLFTPSSLRDAHGRILFGKGGEDEEDPDAVWPRVLGQVSAAEPFGAAIHERSRPKTAAEQECEARPPLPERVARRALALKAVTKRAFLEPDARTPAAGRKYRDLLDWISTIGIGDELEPEEWEVLQRPLGRLDPRQYVDSSWRLEGLVVLAWVLGKFEIPPHDDLVSRGALWRSLGLLNAKDARALLTNPALAVARGDRHAP
jgi:hypothetical protein